MKKQSSNIKELTKRATEAMALLTSEGADEIVGVPGDEYQKLIQGTEAVMTLSWAVNKTHGLRQNPASLKANAQAMAMALTMVHYAYALGVESGRKENIEND